MNGWLRRRSVDAALAALNRELRHWPELLIEEIGRGTTYGGLGPAGEIGPLYPLPGGRMVPSSWVELNTDWWYVIAGAQTGWKNEREHYQGHGRTLLIAINGLTDELHSRRTDPHQWHVDDWMREGRFVKGCADCERDAHELFNDEVEWESA